MAEIGSAYVSLLPSARGFGKATSAQVNPQMATAGAAAGRGFGKSFLKGFLAIGAAIQVTRFLGDAVGEAREAQKVAALTNNVIKTTGGVAKVSAAQVERLADALSRKTGIDDEQIASSQNMLLTFKNVIRQGDGLRNVFARATRAAADLAASGFGDIMGTTKQLGKALNDPVKGLTALGRAGVTFTAGQIERVKGLVAENKLFQAQGLILREVESQVKGAAAAQATNADKARVALNNLKEQIGTALLPALDALSGLFANKIAPALSSFISGLQNGTGAGGRFASFFSTYVRPVFEGIVSFLQNVWFPAFRDALPKVLDGARAAFEKIRSAIQRNEPELRQLFNAAKQIALVFYQRVIPAVYALAGQALSRLGTAISVAINVAAFLVRAYNTVRNAFETVRSVVATAAQGFTLFATAVRQKVSNVLATVRAVPGKIKAALGNLGDLLYSAGQAIIDGLLRGMTSKLGALKKLGSTITGMIPKVKGPPAKDKVLLYGAGQLVMDGFINGIASRQKQLGDQLEKVGKKVKEKVSKIRDQLATARSEFASLVDPIRSAFTGNLFEADTASGFVQGLLGTKGQLQGLVAAFKTLIGQGLKPAFLYDLFQSGNAGLILDLAKNPTLAAEAGGLFSDINSLSDQLGTSVAGATEKGARLENQTVRLEKKLDRLTHSVNQQAQRIGEVINGAASSGRRRAA